jgi:transposase
MERADCISEGTRRAQVGDLYVSLIHTSALVGASPFDYLIELQRHPTGLASNPSERMQWNYSETLAGVGAR